MCLGALDAMKTRWPRARRAVLSLGELAQRWRVAIALPMQRSSQPRASAQVDRFGTVIERDSAFSRHDDLVPGALHPTGDAPPTWDMSNDIADDPDDGFHNLTDTIAYEGGDFIRHDFYDIWNQGLIGEFGYPSREADTQGIFGDFFIEKGFI